MINSDTDDEHELDKLGRFLKRKFIAEDWTTPPNDQEPGEFEQFLKKKFAHDPGYDDWGMPISESLDEGNSVTDRLVPNQLQNEQEVIEFHDEDILGTSGIVSIDKIEQDYQVIGRMIQEIEESSDNKSLTIKKIKQSQSKLDKISAQYAYYESLDGLYSAFYELQSVIYNSQDDSKLALKFIREAARIKPDNQQFISTMAQNWEQEMLATTEESNSKKTAQRKKNRRQPFKHKKAITFTVIIILLLAVAAFAVGPISDYYTIKDANPAMVKLAQNADMTKKGELIFLRTSPQLVSSASLAQECPNNAENNNSFVQQGCYVPNQSDPSTGNIYLLQMPSALYNVEVTTAAYEMLHPVYISLTKNSSNASNLNQSIEDNFSILSDANLTSQVSNFATTEPGDRDLELFSMLGTEYSGISSDLADYYTPYFSNIDTDVSLNNQITQLFQDDANQLTQLESTITQDINLANTAYYDSTTWAAVGNEYENDRNYNIYLQDHNNAVNEYNLFNNLNQQYNILISEFNGQQFSENAPTQSQQTQ